MLFLSWWKAILRWFQNKPKKKPEPSSRYRPGFESFEPRVVPTVTFNGGPVIPHVITQNLFLGSEWQQASLQPTIQAFEKFDHYIVQSRFMDMLTTAGYGVGRGSFLSGKIDPMSIDTSVNLNDTTIRQAIQTEITQGALANPSNRVLYIVYVEPGVVVQQGNQTSANDFTGYHDSFTVLSRQGRDVNIAYAILPYQTGLNAGDPTFTVFQNITSTASHEIAESVTDPGFAGTTAWYDNTNNGEIADLADANIRLNGYVLQEVVNKHDHPIHPLGAIVL